MLSVHLGNSSPVDLGACSSKNKTKMVERLRLLYGFVDCFNFTSISAVEKHTSQKLCHFCHCCWDSEAILSKTVSVPVTRAELFIWKYPQYRDLGRKVRDFGNRDSPASHLKQLSFFPKKRAARRDLGNRASSVDRPGSHEEALFFEHLRE